MKNTRKLIPAVVMLLISAVLMSTASFAWFSMNKEVTATGMSVTATTPASLEIATSSSGAWSYGVTLSKAETGVNPITRYNNKWYVPTATNTIQSNGEATYAIDATYPITVGEGQLQMADCWTEVTLDYTTGLGGSIKYALVQDLYIRTNVGSASGTGVPAAINFAATATVGGTSGLKDGVKVYLVVGGVVTELSSTPAGNWSAPLSSADPNNLKVTVLVVYDGENAAIINSNADLVATTVSVAFTEKT